MLGNSIRKYETLRNFAEYKLLGGKQHFSATNRNDVLAVMSSKICLTPSWNAEGVDLARDGVFGLIRNTDGQLP